MRALLLMLTLAVVLAGCDNRGVPAPKASFANTDITGLNSGGAFVLTDHTGAPRTLADFKGKVVLVFFGFTHCPDVCPTTLSELAGVMKQMGSDADKLQVLFITVDPERDTQETLAGFVPAFDARFLALRGAPAEVEKVARDFKVFVQKVPGKDGKSYTIDHTAGSYVFDPQGRLRLFVRHGQGTDGLISDLRQLMAGA